MKLDDVVRGIWVAFEIRFEPRKIWFSFDWKMYVMVGVVDTQKEKMNEDI